jgi:hypothetical protein
MKLLVLFLILSVFNAAGSVYSQKTFNLNYENVSVGEVLREIESIPAITSFCIAPT